MEFDTPGADHSSLIMPFGSNESENLYNIESRFNKTEPWPADPTWDSQKRMIEALDWSRAREDVRRFVKTNDLPSLDLWSRGYFLGQSKKLGTPQ